MRIFGYEIRRDQPQLESFAKQDNTDASAVVTGPAIGGQYGAFFDLGGTVRNEAELITKYRIMSLDPEVEPAIDNIVNEAIVVEDDQPIVKIDVDALESVPPAIIQIIEQEFDEILQLLDFGHEAYNIFKRWYVDGRLYYHAIIDPTEIGLGIQELRYIDPRKIKKVREIKGGRATDGSTATVQRTVNEYYVYNEAGFDAKPQPGYSSTTPIENGIKIAKDTITYVHSGILNENGTMVLSYLNKAIRPLNMLRTEEDAAVIYRLVRAPERRLWYIDVGNLPKDKAEQYVQQMMVKYKNKVVYDPSTGQIRDDRKHMTMMEDIWLPRREGGKGTEIDTLPGSQNLGQMEEVDYFLKKLYKSLHVPLSRLDPDMVVSLGQASEITRDEVAFSKFIDRIRMRFNMLFLDLLEKQLVLKGIMSPDDWIHIRQILKFIYARDNYFAELKDNRILQERLAVMQAVLPVTGRFVSNHWVRKHIMKQDDEEMMEIDEQIMEERENPIYMVPLDPEGQPMTIDPGMGVPGGMPMGDDEGNSDGAEQKSNKKDQKSK